MASAEYDVIVIGAGPGGYTAAIRASQLGLKTACVEIDKRLGGTCLLRGCIPTKAMLHAADIVSELDHAATSGIQVKGFSVDFPGVMKNKANVVDQNAKGIEYLFKKNKITKEAGRGRLLNNREVEVEQDGKKRTLVAKRGIILAMGSRPRAIGAFPTDGAKIVNSDHILELKKMPKSLAVLGAGAVGTEFASVFSRFGVETMLLEMMDNVLPVEDVEISKELTKALKKGKIDVRTGTKLAEAKKTKTGVALKLEKGGKTEDAAVDMLLVAVGRQPCTQDCGLEKAGVELDGEMVVVDEDLQTNLEGVYAIGDIIRGPMLAHKAAAEAVVAAERLAGEETPGVNYKTVPNATYCKPEVASVGLTEKAAVDQGYDVAIGKFPFAASGKARILGDTTGFIKIVREKKYDEILGVHIIGPHATDLISEACVLIGLECTNEELGRIVHPHPTLGEAMLEASHVAAGHPLAM